MNIMSLASCLKHKIHWINVSDAVDVDSYGNCDNNNNVEDDDTRFFFIYGMACPLEKCFRGLATLKNAL